MPSQPIRLTWPAVRLFLLTVACLFCWTPRVSQAELTRVYPDGQRPEDRRLEGLKDLNGHFPFSVPDSAEAWQRRAEELRRRVLVSTGLWPMPERTPLNAVIHGRVEREAFTVEKVYFESVPNHYVTGLLFRPKGFRGPRPAVLCPHGHGGRLHDYGADKMAELIASGAEKYPDCNRYPKLSLCAGLAQMGCVAFIFDMIGYADSVQISQALAHGFREARPELENPERWGFYTAQAEMRMQSVMGLQTWNSVRALDFLCELPDVDPHKVGVTGGSGGGTQTILLGAIDSRPTVAFPQGMVSTSMQGGCTCENCSLLRIGTGNVELAALFAPKPQAMTAANDWTKAMMTDGYPQLKQLYTLLGAGSKVYCENQLQFPHNYNYAARAVMYNWFNEHLKLSLPSPVVEQHWVPLTAEEWTVWNADHPRPEGGLEYELKLVRQLADADDQQIAKLTPHDATSLATYREVVGGAVQTLIGRGLPMAGTIQREKKEKQDIGDYLFFKDVLRHINPGEVLPIVSFYPKATPWNNEVVIWVDGAGKAGVMDPSGAPNPAIQQLLRSGMSVVSADLLYQGEFLPDDQPLKQAPTVANPRAFAGYTFGYNHTVFAQRVHDILTLISWIRNEDHAPQKVHLLGVHGAGPLVAAARAIAGDQVARAAVDTQGFRFTNVTSYRDPQFLPGAVKYGDLPALLALSAPLPLFIAGEQGELPKVVEAAYQAANAPNQVRSWSGPAVEAPLQAAVWLTTKK